MWLCAGKDVTSDNEIEQPAPPQPLQKRGAHPAGTRADGWVGDDTDRALAWINLGGQDGEDERGRR